jgi:hypothetical protein
MINLAEKIRNLNAEPRRRYVALLHVFDSSNLEHLAQLDKLRVKLGLTPEQVGRDFEVISEVHRLNASLDRQEMGELRAALTEADSAVLKHIELHQKFVAKWKEDQGALANVASSARGHLNAALEQKRNATKRLDDLANERPDLLPPVENDEPQPRSAA